MSSNERARIERSESVVVVPPRLTAYHARYYAHDLTRKASGGIDRLSMALFDASVDLNPHQVEAALFALQSPLSSGVMLADEVGLGKTIEAGIVLCQLWAERKRRLLVICPASLRKQWELELSEKFNLPAVVLDAKGWREAVRRGEEPLQQKSVLIISMNFAHSIGEELQRIAWNMVVIDEAHKLRNAYRPGNKVGQSIRNATKGCPKLLLTATPLQNSLLELYGLSTLIDEHLFGGIEGFRDQYMGVGGSIEQLRERLSRFCKRTLRQQVSEYIRYTERRALTRPFRPTDNEHALYEAVSSFLQQEESYALPRRQRHLTALILRKLLASSSQAIAATLDTLRKRLETLRDEKLPEEEFSPEALFDSDDMDTDLLDEILNDQEEEEGADENGDEEPAIDRKRLVEEIDTLRRLAEWARCIGTDTKAKALLTALETGFEQMSLTGASRKALIFTESRRTQEFLKGFLETHGYGGKVLLYNGSNSGPEATAAWQVWLERNADNGRPTGNRSIDVRTALIESFRDDATIMLATEAAAEGINLQFCSLVINYDLPWNPQRIEQRIGRCHRYGQQHDVVVINFLNERNAADRRVLELLTQKFRLFSGIFGASDEVLGAVESGVDFEKRILDIYQQCRSTEEIDAAFEALQAEMETRIRSRLDDTRKALFEHFDEDVHERLRIQLDDTRIRLDRFSRRFWNLTRYMLGGRAAFDEGELAFDLQEPPRSDISPGRYHLISKSYPTLQSKALEEDGTEYGRFLYRLSHPLGEYVTEQARTLDTPSAKIIFDATHHQPRSLAVEKLRGKSGHLSLMKLVIDTYGREEYLLFSGFEENGTSLDQESMEKLFGCEGTDAGPVDIPEAVLRLLSTDAERHMKATISRSLDRNSTYFNQSREKLEQWADEMVLSAEKRLVATKEQIKAQRRLARQAETLEEQHRLQQKIQKLEKQQRRQRMEIFTVEDEISAKRDALIEALEKRLSQKTEAETLFTIAWSVV